METATKIFKSGNSSAILINKSILKQAGLRENDEVTVNFDKISGQIIITPKKKSEDIHSEFYGLLDYAMKSDKEVLDYLKDK